jgi:hypothetical protein
VAVVPFLGVGARASPTTWVQVDHPALVGGVHVVYAEDPLALGNGQGWLVGGYVVDSDGMRIPSVWRSGDGISWTRATLPQTSSNERRDGVFQLARRGNVTVALGQRYVDGVRPAAWRGVNGKWTALTDPADPLLAFPGSVEAVTTTSDGFAAVGVTYATAGVAARVFTSTDGTRWDALADIPYTFGQRFVPLSIAASRDTIVVAGDSGDSPDAGRIWVYRGTWTQVDPTTAGLSGPGPHQVSSVVYRQGFGWIAGGEASRLGVEIPAVWVSPDAVNWRRLPDDTVPSSAGGAAVHRIVGVADGFLAAGASGSGALVWKSPDGLRWTSIDAPKQILPGGERVSVASSGQTILLDVARSNGSNLYRLSSGASSWSSVEKPPAFPSAGTAVVLESVAASTSRVITVGVDARGRPLLMASSNGRSWTRLPFDDPKARLNAISVNRGTFTIAGWRLIGGRAHLAVWTSRSGARWHRVGGGALDPIGIFVDIAADGRTSSALAVRDTGRGFETSVWSIRAHGYLPATVLGRGEARAICIGPGGALALATRDSGATESVVAWRRQAPGPWSGESESVTARGSATSCEVGSSRQVVGGIGAGGASFWVRDPDGRWEQTTLAATAPPTTIEDVIRDGSGFIATGSSGARGQADLGIWQSSNGVSWRSLATIEPVFIEPGYQAGRSILRYHGKLIVVGQTGAGNGGIWVGS